MPEDKNSSGLDAVVKRLDVLIYLLLDCKRKEGKTNRDLIKELAGLSLNDMEISQILGRTRSYVSSELTKIKKNSKNGGNE